MSRYDWYDVVNQDTPFEQGDFFDRVPIPILTITESIGGEPEYKQVVEKQNVILMTQSCDLQDFHDEDAVLLCARVDYSIAAAERPKTFGKQNGWNNLLSGRISGAHLLNLCEIEEHRCDYQVVDLKRVYSVPFTLLRYYSTLQTVSRLRLLPPYREHLAQAFARQFMRVGLPIDLPREYPHL